ncbi:MAG TPA: hypothetical protein DEH25_15575 [Chloroflexi bacterium]|nr:hypothetical protein [Chloroflexota bacterium]HBY07448.1 hypothetical protein [Chloroflexota bacterium]
MKRFNEFLDQVSNYLAHRKGLLPFVGILLIVLNLIFQLIPGLGWLTTSNLFLHLGVILSIVGIMLAWAL